MVRITITCQKKDCGKEFHDISEYYAHVNSHEEEEKVNK